MHEEYDVLAARRQRAEAAGSSGPYSFRIGKKRYTWPEELPAESVEMIGELKSITDDKSPEALAATTALVRILSGDQADELLKLLSINDLVVMVPAYLEQITGSRLGESSESPESSPDTPKPPRRTSKRSTVSTSSTTTGAR